MPSNVTLSPSTVSLPTTINWAPCFSDRGQDFNATFQCANLTVPMDYLNNISSKTTQLGIAKLIPNELKKSEGLLFIATYLGESAILSQDVDLNLLPLVLNLTDRKYDVMLVDSRGVGWSNYLTCGFPELEWKQHDLELEANVLSSPLNGGAASLTAQVNYYAQLAGPPCSSGADPDYLANMNMPALARDIELVRDLSGVDTLDFYGVGDGSIIGIAYSALFPTRVGKMVLDNVPNFGLYMGITGNILDASFNAGLDISKIITQFASSCVAAGQHCPLASASQSTSNPTTDIVKRINSIVSALLQQSYVTATGELFNTKFFTDGIVPSLATPQNWTHLATQLVNLENAIKSRSTASLGETNPGDHSPLIPSSDETNTNLTFASYNAFGDPFEANNMVQKIAVTCSTSNFTNVQTTAELLSSLSKQISQNPVIAFTGLSDAVCLNWTNLTTHNVEQMSPPFPPSVQNKMLIIAETNNPINSYEGVLSTYQYVGTNNAHVLIHDALGQTIDLNPNDCTYNAIKALYLNGHLPVNGTHCQTNNTGRHNPFLLANNDMVLVTNNTNNHQSALKLGLGLGLGLGFPLLVISIILIGFWGLRRKASRKRKDAWLELQRRAAQNRDAKIQAVATNSP